MMNWSRCFALLAFLFIQNLPLNGFGQINLQRYINDYENGTTTEQISAIRGLASFVIRQQSTDQERVKILEVLKAAVGCEDPVLRLTVHTELLKISAAENDSELGLIAMSAANDKHLNVRRGMMKYFRTFFSKRYNFGKSFEKLIIQKLSDEDLDIRFQAAATLHSWGICNRDILDILIDGMQLRNYRASITYALVSDLKFRDQTIQNISQRLDESGHFAGVYIDLLSLMTPESNRLMPRILEMYDSDQIEVRASVVAAIGKMKTDNENSLAVLKKAIKDPHPSIRIMAIPSLIRLDPAPELVKETTLMLLDDPDASVAELAASTFSFFESNFGFLLPDLRERLSGDDNDVIVAVLNGLAICGPLADTAAPDVIQLLKHDSFDIRIRAVWALSEIIENPEVAIKAFNELLETEPNEAVVVAALQALSRYQPTDDASKLTFLKFLDSDNDYLRLASIEGLKKYRDAAIVEKLIRQERQLGRRYGDNLNQLDNAIVDVVVATGKAGAEVAARFLDSSDPVIRSRALRIVGASEGGIDRDTAISGLTDKNPLVSYCAAIATSQMEKVDQAVLKQMFGLTDGNQRQRTVNVLNLFGEMGANAGPITPKIAGLLNGQYRNRFANDAKRVLVKLGPAAAPAIGELLKGSLNFHKLDCLAAIGTPAADATDLLTDHIQLLGQKMEKNRNVATRAAEVRDRLFAAVALSRVSNDSQTANELIRLELDGDNQTIALACALKLDAPASELIEAIAAMLPDKQALQTLGDLGPKAKLAQPQLEALAAGENKELALVANEALWKIRDDSQYAIDVINQLLWENRYELVDIKIEHRQLLWAAIRYLHEHRTDGPNQVAALDKLKRSRFPNLRTFMFDLPE